MEQLSNAVYLVDYGVSVDKNGNVYRNGAILKTSRDYKGYPRVVFKEGDKIKNFRVHRLVAIAYVPNPDNLPVVNHIDGDKENCRVENLEWCSIKENTVHAYRTLGNRVLNGKIPNKKVLVRDKKGKEKVFESIRLAADFVGCCPQHLSSLLKKRTGTRLEYEFEYA